MKALEILKWLKELKSTDFFGNERPIKKELVDSINEAIAELEAMAQPKTCDGCEYYEYNYLHKCETCSRLIRNDYYKPMEPK